MANPTTLTESGGPRAPRRLKPPPDFVDDQEERVQRALTEFPNYEFYRDPAAGGRWLECLNVESGETYEVSPFNCTCWDWATHCRGPRGLVCKHMVMLELAIQNGSIRPMPGVIPARPAR